MDSVKIFKEYLSRVTESSNKPNELHKQQLTKSSNELIDMYVQAKQEAEDERKWANTYFKELQEAKIEIQRLEGLLIELSEFYSPDI